MPADAENLTEALIEIDVGELQLGLELIGRRGAGEPERAFEGAAEGLRFADRDVEVAAAELAPMAVRPSLALASFTRAAESRRSTSSALKPSSAIGIRFQARSPPTSRRTVDV